MALIAAPPTPTTWTRRRRARGRASVDAAEPTGKSVPDCVDAAAPSARGRRRRQTVRDMARGPTRRHRRRRHRRPHLPGPGARRRHRRRARPTPAIAFVGTPRGLEGDARPGGRLPARPLRHGAVQRPGLAQGARARRPAPRARLAGPRRPRAGGGPTSPSRMGGYAGVPLVIGARLAGVPSLVHEPGAVPGQANRLAARFTAPRRHVVRRRRRLRPARAAPRRLPAPAGDRRLRPRRAPRRGPRRLRPRRRPRHGARHRRQPGLAVAEPPGRSAWPSAGRTATTSASCSRPGPATHDEIAAALAANPGGHLVDLVALHRAHGPRLRGGRPRHLPGRRRHGRRARRRRPAVGPRAASRTTSTTSSATTPAPLVDAGGALLVPRRRGHRRRRRPAARGAARRPRSRSPPCGRGCRGGPPAPPASSRPGSSRSSAKDRDSE